MRETTKEYLKWGALGAVAVLGGAYLLHRVNPDLSDRVGATWLLRKFRLAPTVYEPDQGTPIYPVATPAAPSPPMTQVAQDVTGISDVMTAWV